MHCHPATEIKRLLGRLDGAAADQFESQTLDFTSWDVDPRRTEPQLRALRESVICFANARGGTIVLGVHDRKRTRADAIHGVGSLDANTLRRNVYEGTAPHILVDVEELIESERRLLVVHVPRGLPPHTTSDGIAKVRVGKECKPLTGPQLRQLLVTQGGQLDVTEQSIAGATIADLDPDEIARLRATLASEGGRKELADLAVPELLGNLGLLRDGEANLAAILLLGRSVAIARHAPQHEVIFVRFKDSTNYDVRRNFKGPLLAVFDELRKLLDTPELTTVATAGFQELAIPKLSWTVAREAVLNALVHRDWFLRQSVQIELRADRLIVMSPGGFIGGVTPSNLLRHEPMRRNPLLASAFEALGFVNRVGAGVDRIYEELLRFGKGMPRWDADEAHVRATIPLATHAEFARFVASERGAGRSFTLDELIVLRGVADCGFADRWTAATALQLSEDEAARVLVALRERGFLVPQGRGRGTMYRFTRPFSDLVRGRDATNVDLPLDDEALRLRIRTVLEERGALTNAELRRLSGFSRSAVWRLMQPLIEDGIARLEGVGRGARYLAGKQRRTIRRRARRK